MLPRQAVIAVAQYAPGSGDVAAARNAAVRMANRAADMGADLVLMPELMTTPYFALERKAEVFDWAEPIPGPTVQALSDVARQRRMYIVAPLFERAMSGVYYNSAALINREGQLAGVYRKTHIPAVKSIEKWYFRAGPGLPVFDTDFGRIGILICQDRVFPEPMRVLALKGASLILVANAAAGYSGIDEMWKPLQKTRAFENSVYVASSNRVGVEGEYKFFGQSLIFGPLGEELAVAGDQEEVIAATVDLPSLERQRAVYQIFRDTRPELYGPLADSALLAPDPVQAGQVLGGDSQAEASANEAGGPQPSERQ